MSFSVPHFNEYLPKSLAIELLAKSLLENKQEVRIFSSKNVETGSEKYLKRTIRSLKIFDAFTFRTQKFLGIFSFRQKFVRN